MSACPDVQGQMELESGTTRGLPLVTFEHFVE